MIRGPTKCDNVDCVWGAKRIKDTIDHLLCGCKVMVSSKHLAKQSRALMILILHWVKKYNSVDMDVNSFINKTKHDTRWQEEEYLDLRYGHKKATSKQKGMKNEQSTVNVQLKFVREKAIIRFMLKNSLLVHFEEV